MLKLLVNIVPISWFARALDIVLVMFSYLPPLRKGQVWGLAAALAKLKDGLVEGLQPDRRLTPDEAIARAREALEAANNR
jgi:hypothetical protein